MQTQASWEARKRTSRKTSYKCPSSSAVARHFQFCTEVTRSRHPGRLGERGGVHPHDLPDIAVGILDVAVEQEAEILRRVGGGAPARGNGPLQRRIHGVAAVAAQRDHSLA